MGCLVIVFFIFGALFGGASLFDPNPPIIDYDPLPAPTELALFNAPLNTSAADLDAAAAVLSARLQALGIAPDVRVYANEQPMIGVLLPGNTDLPDVLGVLVQRGYLELVDLSGINPDDYANTPLWTTGQERLTEVIPDDATHKSPLTTILDSSAIQSAEPNYSDDYGTWGVLITFTDEGAATLEAFSTDHIGEPLGIVLDGKVLSAPILQTVISDQALITGDFTQKEARYLAAQIGSGMLPIPLTFDRLS